MSNKGILNKHLYKKFFWENWVPIFLWRLEYRRRRLILIMMDKNKEIFLAGADVLVYLAEAMHKKYSTTSVLGHLFSTYVSYDRSSCTYLYTFWTSSSIPPAGYVLNGWPISHQKTNKHILILYWLKYKHSKKNFFKKK